MEPVNIGLDIGATKTLGVVVDGAGSILAEVREPTEPGGYGVVRTAARVVEGLRGATAAGRADVVGIGIPGLVDHERGTVKHAVNLGLDGAEFPLGALLGDRLGLPVVVENDVNAAALGAVALSGEDDLLYLSVGTGPAVRRPRWGRRHARRAAARGGRERTARPGPDVAVPGISGPRRPGPRRPG